MRIISRLGQIEKEKWIQVVKSNEYLIPLHIYYKSDTEVYDSAVLQIDKIPYGRILWNGETKFCDIDVEKKYLSKVYKALLSIGNDLGADLFISKNEKFDHSKHLPVSTIEIERDKKYFENHDLDYIRWMAFREEDRMAILKALKLEVSKEVNLKYGINGNELLITPAVSGWTFIIGDNLSNVFINKNVSSSKEDLTNLCKYLQKLSKKFIEVQYFEHDGKSNITGYFKANNGKLVFGYWKSETEEFTKGKVPKEIKVHHPTSAHDVAAIWSIDPLDFIYLKEMSNQKSSVLTYL